MNIDHILSNNDLNSVELNLRTLINSFKLTGNSDNKKTLIEFLKGIFINFKTKVSLSKSLDFLNLMWNNIHDLAGLFPEILNSEIKSHLDELNKFLKNEDEDTTSLANILKCSLMIVCLTKGLGSTNQMLSNYVILINMMVNKQNIIEENHLLNTLLKLHFTSTLVKLCENTNSYNPQLISSLETLINSSIEQISQGNKHEYQNSDMSLLNLIELSLENNCSNEFSNVVLSLVIPKILDNLTILMKTFNDDINFSLIFKRIINSLGNLNSKLSDQVEKESNNSLFNTIISKSNEVINSYNSLSISNNQKKNVEINFMKIKKKSIPSLEPDIERAFLGARSYLPVSEDPIKAKAIERKIKSTKKQAIRNLKNEAKVIDVQRQKKLKIIEGKRKEDIKLSNQFVEQQNIEYKKMVTSQPDKRFKLKRKRGDTRNVK